MIVICVNVYLKFKLLEIKQKDDMLNSIIIKKVEFIK